METKTGTHDHEPLWEDRLADAIYEIARARDLSEEAFNEAANDAVNVLAAYVTATGVDITARVRAATIAALEPPR